jgi:hypothetical protein
MLIFIIILVISRNLFLIRQNLRFLLCIHLVLFPIDQLIPKHFKKILLFSLRILIRTFHFVQFYFLYLHFYYFFLRFVLLNFQTPNLIVRRGLCHVVNCSILFSYFILCNELLIIVFPQHAQFHQFHQLEFLNNLFLLFFNSLISIKFRNKIPQNHLSL